MRGRGRMAVGVGALAAAGLLAPAARAVPPRPVVRAAAPAGVYLPAAPGTGLVRNHDSEPGAGVEPDGTLWATSTVIRDPRGGAQDIWTSTDRGRSWRWVADPFANAVKNLGGGDADIAVATAPNASGHVNVYAASLYVLQSVSGLLIGDISLAVSVDGGAHWILHPLAAEIPGDDRPWLATDGPCRVYLTYHALPTVANVVNTYDLCDPVALVEGLTLTPIESTRYPQLAVPALLGARATYVTVGFGKPVVDLRRHVMYEPAMDCPNMTLAQEVARAEAVDAGCPPGTRAEVYLEVATANATSWVLKPVVSTPNNEVATWPNTVAVDPAGCVDLAWHDNHDSFMSVSCDGGDHWRAPVRLNTGGAAVYPTVTVEGRTIAVAWYQSDRPGDANDRAVMGAPNAPGAATWSLVGATSTDGGRTFSAPTTLDPIVHTGVLCTKGDGCTIPNSRTLLDDFAAVPNPGASSVTFLYGNDRPAGTFADVGTKSVTMPVP